MLFEDDHMPQPDFSEYIYEGLYKSPPLNQWFWIAWCRKDLAQRHGLAYSHDRPMVFINGGHLLVHRDTLTDARRVLSEFLQNPDSLEKIVQSAEIVFRNAAHAEFTADDPDGDMRMLIDKGRDLLFYWGVGWSCSTQLTDILAEAARAYGLSLVEITEYLAPLRSPLMDSHVALEEVRQGRMSTEDYLRKYDWTSYLMFFGTPLNATDVAEQLRMPVQTHASRKDPNDALRPLVDLADKIGWLNQTGAEYCSILGRRARLVFDAYAAHFRITPPDVSYLIPEELLDTKLTPESVHDIVERRKRGGWSIWRGDHLETVIVDDAALTRQLAVKYIPRAASNISQLTGTVGSPGIARGRVRVVESIAKSDGFEVGDVLVTSMTTPEFVLIMQKSSAIVTEMGGLLSHAAILSRELRKPCVVGTKIATQVLKDGDVVEVDAERGIVTIITKTR